MAGIYGKMPSKGDFINRGLCKEFVAVVDPWLQQGMSESRSVLGDAWLSYYQITPIWHYYLSAGVIDQQSWCGVWIPSEDRVNRSFPLTVVAPITEPVRCLKDLRAYNNWFRLCEDLLLEALSSDFDFHAFCDSVLDVEPMAQAIEDTDQHPDHVEMDSSVEQSVRQSYEQLQMRVASLENIVDQLRKKLDLLYPDEKTESDTQLEFEDLVSVDQSDEQSNQLVLLKNMNHAQSIILDIPLGEVHPNSCVWLSSGSEEISHQIVITAGLPDSAQFVKFLTGF